MNRGYFEGKPIYKGIGYWYSDSENYFPDPAWFIDENYNREEKEKVILYLNESKALIGYRGFSWCRFGCKEGVPGTSDLTDGEYVYPSGLIHYVEHHNVRLPKEFVNKILGVEIPPVEQLTGKEDLGNYRRDHSDFFVDFNWWIKQQGIDNSKSSRKEPEDPNAPKIYIYKDGTKKIETDDKIEMIFTDGTVKVIKKES